MTNELELSLPPAWTLNARCAELDADAWFPQKGGPTKAVKDICAACEVRDACLAYALDNHIDHGIWAGTTTKDRRAMQTTRKPYKRTGYAA